MSSPVQDTADDASTCAEQQLVEMETLQSIYSQDELQFDTDCAPYIMSYCDRCLNNENSEDVIAEVISQLKNEDLCLGLTLKLLMDGHPVEIKCDLPQSYPVSSPPLVFVRATGFKSRTSQAAFRKELDGFINNLELGDAMLFTVLDWLSDELPKHLVSGDMKADETPLDGPCSFTRMWIYSHHIYSKFKRRDIIAWAAELKLHGFSMCGKPGMICIEGHTEDIEEYWSRLRRLNWKRLVMKEREDMKCDTHKQLSEMYRFEMFEEMVFGSRAGKGYSVSFHADIGDLLKFLQERKCSHIFEMYFGIDGTNKPTEASSDQ